MKFYLGTHRTHWLALSDVPLFVSHRQLAPRKSLPVATCDFALDSGGFTELEDFGFYRQSASEYVASVRRYASEIGRLQWAAIQDWMCVPKILKITGKTVEQHQRLTLENYLELRSLDADLHFVPVLQGDLPDDYLRHCEMYQRAGVELQNLDLVGVGGIAQRQQSRSIHALCRRLHKDGLRLHGFGVKLVGLRDLSEHLDSADSLAWSFYARHEDALPGHDHKRCQNCLEYALQWRENLLNDIESAETQSKQMWLDGFFI